MLVLVANLGSTSFKYKLLDMELDGRLVTRGSYDRIGQKDSPFQTHADVIDVILKELKEKPEAIGFKAVHGGPISGAVRVTDEVIATMQQFADIAPAHNPAYINAMKSFREKLPEVPQVAAFETAFHQTIPKARQVYAIPFEWTEKLGIRRYGFHGASHRYIAMRVSELVPDARRIISCHLGGSSSICAIENGKSVATSMGLTPQTGLPHNNRVGDFDIFAMLRLLKQKMSIDDVLKMLGRDSGLLGISGVSNDMRDIELAAASGNGRAKLAIDAFVESARHYIGAYLVALGGCDVLAFTGGIGENAISIRDAICRNLEFAGIMLDHSKNQVRGQETKISHLESNADVWVVPTNEELIVAMQTVAVLSANQELVMTNGEAIGLIETKGIVAALEACDAALKAANVEFVEQHKVGSGLVAVTFKGDVAAVRAAIDAGAEAAGRIGEVVSVHVIPRPHGDVAKMG